MMNVIVTNGEVEIGKEVSENSSNSKPAKKRRKE